MIVDLKLMTKFHIGNARIRGKYSFKVTNVID